MIDLFANHVRTASVSVVGSGPDFELLAFEPFEALRL